MATLTAACSASDTTLTLGATDDLPVQAQFNVDIEGERVLVLDFVDPSYHVLRTAGVSHAAGVAVTYVSPTESPAATALRGRLTAYLGNTSPTAADTVSAVKDLIRAVRYLARQ